LNILIKLMSMVSLTIAPLLKEENEAGAKVGNDDWENAWIGFIPLVLLLVATLALMYLDILTWKDPLLNVAGMPGESTANPEAENTPLKVAAQGEVGTPGGIKPAWE